jgi:cytochrome c oxidase subunit 2
MQIFNFSFFTENTTSKQNKQYVIRCDAAEPFQFGNQDPATPTVEGMLHFHNYLMIFLIAVVLFVLWMLFRVTSYYGANLNPVAQKFTHSSLLEIIWTIIPAFILVLVAIPSFALLYSLEELIDPVVTLKIVGHQWYWSYEYSDYVSLNGSVERMNFDSYMVQENDLTKGAFRLLEVDNRVMLPKKTHIRLLITSADVLHSWAVPSFGIKVDACPGRLSQAALFIKREGTFYGQCSEICGINHGFMPIVVNSVPSNYFISWIALKLDDLISE